MTAEMRKTTDIIQPQINLHSNNPFILLKTVPTDS